MDASDQQSFQPNANQTPSQLVEPTKKQPKLNSLGLAFPSKSEFEVLNTLNLPGKSTLMLIKVNSDRLMVATDSTGVKSVVHLTDSFTENIDA